MKFHSILLPFLLNTILSKVSANSSCLFNECLCSTNFDNSTDIKCILALNTNKTGFPERLNSSNSTTYDIINTFLINKYTFSALPDDPFEGLDIKYLILGQNNLHSITRDLFRGINSLSSLRLIEKDLTSIEPNSLHWLSDSLTELGLYGVNFDQNEIDNFFKELLALKHLNTLRMNNMKFETFKSGWAYSIQNISYLSLASNNLKSLGPDLLKSSLNLISLDLSNNQLSDLNELTKAIQPVKKNLKELRLNANLIENLIDFTEMDNLELLDLSQNKIEQISETTFGSLRHLNYLYLTANKLRVLNQNLFQKSENLITLLLNKNYLSIMPNIVSLNKLQILDVSEQNGNLKHVPDFAFERRNVLGNSLSIYLNSNEISLFGNKTFCSRYSTVPEIHNINLSFKSMKKLDKCALKQLKTSIVSRVIIRVEKSENVTLDDYSEACNCDMKLFAANLRIDLGGVCDSFSEKCIETKFSHKDCLGKFDCP